MEQHYRLHEMLLEFSHLFRRGEESDRAIAIVGPAYLDSLLSELLINFFIDDRKEVERLIQPEGPLGTYGSKVSACYCLGFFGETIKADLRAVGKIRNKFAHDLRAKFSDGQIADWCKSLTWHRESLLREPPAEATTRDLFQVGVNQLVTHLNGLLSMSRTQKREKART